MEVSKMMVFEIELSLFCDFFPLWSNIDPYTYRAHHHSAILFHQLNLWIALDA